MMPQELRGVYMENKKRKVLEHLPLFTVGLTMNEKTLILVNQMFCNEADHRPLACEDTSMFKRYMNTCIKPRPDCQENSRLWSLRWQTLQRASVSLDTFSEPGNGIRTENECMPKITDTKPGEFQFTSNRMDLRTE